MGSIERWHGERREGRGRSIPCVSRNRRRNGTDWMDGWWMSLRDRRRGFCACLVLEWPPSLFIRARRAERGDTILAAATDGRSVGKGGPAGRSIELDGFEYVRGGDRWKWRRTWLPSLSRTDQGPTPPAGAEH